MRTSFFNCFKISLVLLLSISSAQAAAAILPSDLETLRASGFRHLFNMEYEQAKSDFEEMIDVAPDHPAGYVYLANAVWLGHLGALRRLQTGVYNRGSSFFDEDANDEVDPVVDREFNKHVDRAIELTEAVLETHKKDSNAMYYLGIAKNLRAAYEATVKRKFFSALRNGSKGVGLHRDIIKKDPTFIDAYLSVAMYDYIVGSLPLAVKILIFFGGIRGSKKDGLAELEKTYKEGTYAKDEAGVLLVMLYKREKRLDDALEVLNTMCEKFPGNLLLRLERSMTLAELGHFKESYQAFEAMLQDQRTMDYMPDLVHFQYAEALSDAGEWERARAQYMEASASPKAPDGMKSIALLRAGNCLDMESKRSEAIEIYQTVLKRKEIYDSHDQAKRYIKKPFKPKRLQ